MFPHSRTFTSQAELQEERRLMYVAMTRARDELYLTRAQERFYFGDYLRNPESRFLKEIPQDLIEEIQDTTYLENSRNFFSQSFSGISESFSPAYKKPQRENDISSFSVGDKVEHHKF